MALVFCKLMALLVLNSRLNDLQYINLPLTALALIMVLFGLPLKRVDGDLKQKLKQIDYLGSFLMLSSLTLILLPISWYEY
jgi:hypothetical protein